MCNGAGDAACPGLAEDKWLANADYWTLDAGAATVVSKTPTALKKSEIECAELPPSELKQVGQGAKCTLGAGEMAAVHGYYGTCAAWLRRDLVCAPFARSFVRPALLVVRSRQCLR